MSSAQVVLLFDLSAFFMKECTDELQNDLLCLRSCCLRLLTEFNNRAHNFRFGYKFFDLFEKFNGKMDKHPLCELSLENFENLESEICLRYERYSSYRKLLTSLKHHMEVRVSGPENASPLVRALNLNFKQILCDYEWNAPDICSPVKNGKLASATNITKNYVFLISACPVRSCEILDFFGTEQNLTDKAIQELLMPNILHQKFINEARISLVWLDTSATRSSHFVMSDDCCEVQLNVDLALQSFNGHLIPLRILSQACSFDLQSAKRSAIDVTHHRLSSFIPFSTLFSYFISDSNRNVKSSSCANLCHFSLKSDELIVVKLFPILLHKSANDQISVSNKKKKSLDINVEEEILFSPKWRKLSIEGYCECGFYGPSESTLLCLPAETNSIPNNLALVKMLQFLLDKKLDVVLNCEDEDGQMSLGILSPATANCGLISVPCALVKDKAATNFTSLNNFSANINALDKYFEKNVCFKDLEKLGNESVVLPNEEISRNFRAPFQMASVEKWFVPSLGVSTLVEEIKTQCSQINNSLQSNFLKKLQNSYRFEFLSTPRKRKLKENYDGNMLRRSPRLKRLCSNVSAISSSFGEADTELFSQCSQFLGHNSHTQLSDHGNIPAVACTMPEYTDESQIVHYLKDIYDSAVKPNGSIVTAVKSIVSTVVSFLQTTDVSNMTDAVWEFVDHNLLATALQIHVKYEGKSEADKINEYKMQVILSLELESTYPSSFDNCVRMVTALLRALSFAVGPTELMQFLQDVVKENYGQCLCHILKQIEEELNVPIVSQLLSPSSASDMESPINMCLSSNLSCNSMMSCRSSSSMSSQRDLNSLRRTFSQTFESRQIIVPKRLLKNQTEVMKVRRSPRLIQRHQDSMTPSKEIRRNLFSADNSPLAKHSKKLLFTPKGHHTLKTRYVAETPSPKQGVSSIQRKLSRLRQATNSSIEVEEISESPIGTGLVTDVSFSLNKTPDIKNVSSVSSSCAPCTPNRQFTINGCSKRLFETSTPPKSDSNLMHNSCSRSDIHKSVFKRSLITPSTSSEESFSLKGFHYSPSKCTRTKTVEMDKSKMNYSAPSTESVFHLTTSPVIILEKCQKTTR